MKQHKDILIKNSFEKAEEALKTAKINIENNLFDGAQNRIYYAVFYSAMALGYYKEKMIKSLDKAVYFVGVIRNYIFA